MKHVATNERDMRFVFSRLFGAFLVSFTFVRREMSIFMNKTIDVSDHRHIFAKSGRATPIVLVGFGVFD